MIYVKALISHLSLFNIWIDRIAGDTRRSSPLFYVGGDPPHIARPAQTVPDMVLKRFGLFVGILSLVWVFVQIGYGLLMR